MKHQKVGFTLIELSIVLVIIGLVVGGILVGQDLIHAASLRAMLSQVQSFQQAVNTFSLKYNDLPGDVLASKATAFGLHPRAGGRAHGDGDGFLDGNASSIESYNICGENALFWNDLSTTQLIPGQYSGQDGDATTGGCGSANIPSVLPLGKLDPNTFYIVYGDASDGKNYFQILTFINSTFINNVGTLQYYGIQALTNADSYYMDQKIDDGLPLTGNITARDPANSDTIGVPVLAATYCIAQAGVNTYNLGNPIRACSIRFPFN